MNTILDTIRLKYKYVIKPIFLPHPDSFFDRIQKGDIAIDCGANVGDITQKMVDKGAIVHAFEPNPHAFEILKTKFGNNKQVILHNMGVWDKNTSMKLYLHNKSDEDPVGWSVGASIISEKENVNKNNFIEIKIIDLTEFISSLKREIKILKIDIEGAECELLDKIIDLGIYKQIGILLVETHEIINRGLRDKTNMIRKKIKQKKIKNINLNWG